MEKGLSPVITVVLLIGLVVGMGTTTFMFLSNQQEFVDQQANKAQLETVNVTCSRQVVTWWIENTAKYGVNDMRGEIFFTENGMQNRTLFMENEPVPPRLSSGTSQARLQFPTNQPLKTGQRYHMKLDLTDNGVSATCTAGESWWDVNWDYRRRIALSASTRNASGHTSIELDTKQMVRDGKLQPHCQDLRIVIDGSPISFRTNPLPGNCVDSDATNVTFQVNNLASAEYSTYVYYGNPSAEIPFAETIDLHYILDTSWSFDEEWDTMEDNISVVEDELEADGVYDVSNTVWGFNNSFGGEALNWRVCSQTQTLPDSFNSSPYCGKRSNIISDISTINGYLSWLNAEHGLSLEPSTYDPYNVPGSGTVDSENGESPTEGWGMTLLDVLDRATWRGDAHRVVINVADHDTNGGGSKDGAPSCGDANSESLASNLSDAVDDQNVVTISLLANPECSDDPGDGTHDSYAERQMDLVGDVLRYDEASQLPDKIANEIAVQLAGSAPRSPLEAEERSRVR